MIIDDFEWMGSKYACFSRDFRRKKKSFTFLITTKSNDQKGQKRNNKQKQANEKTTKTAKKHEE